MKDFTLYPQALALKELGFNEPCLGRWLVITKWEEPTGEVRLQIGFDAETWDKNQCLAPTYSEAFSFFREKYKLNSWIETGSEGIQIANIFTSHKIHVGHYALYEEAELALLKSLIKIVKNKSI